MAKQVSKTVIGGFVISAIALLVIGVIVFGGGKFFKKTYQSVIFFKGSVKGLKVGSPVVFRGVQIGSCGELKYDVCKWVFPTLKAVCSMWQPDNSYNFF